MIICHSIVSAQKWFNKWLKITLKQYFNKLKTHPRVLANNMLKHNDISKGRLKHKNMLKLANKRLLKIS